MAEERSRIPSFLHAIRRSHFLVVVLGFLTSQEFSPAIANPQNRTEASYRYLPPKHHSLLFYTPLFVSLARTVLSSNIKHIQRYKNQIHSTQHNRPKTTPPHHSSCLFSSQFLLSCQPCTHHPNPPPSMPAFSSSVMEGNDDEQLHHNTLSRSPNSVDSLLLMGGQHGRSNNNYLRTKNSDTTFTSSKKNKKEDDDLLSLADFIQELPAAIHQRKVHSIEPGAPNDPICKLFRCTDWSSSRAREEWEGYALFDSSRPYTRNLIATDHTTYTLLCLCWNPNQESPIHDHPCDGCWMQVCQGSVQECRYHPSTLECTSDVVVSEGTLAYITDSMGYHKVGNPHMTRPAITIHLYSPPFHECKTWCATEVMTTSAPQKGGDGAYETPHPLPEPKLSHSCHYSEYGHVL